MITCEHLTVRAADGDERAVLRSISLRVEPGRVRAIVGGAGSGKTVLAAALRGVLPPGLSRASGWVRVTVGESGDEPPQVSGPGAVAWLCQDATAGLLGAASVRDALRAALAARFPAATPDDLTMCAALARLGLNDARLLDRDPAELTPGLLRRVALAQALVRPALTPAPALVVFDEPLAGLDRAVAEDVIDAIRGMRRAIRSTVLVLTRDLELAQRYADEISVLEGGQIVETFYPERAVLGRAAGASARPAEAAGHVPAPAGMTAQGEAPRACEQPRRAARASRRRAPALELRDFSVLLPNGREAIPAVSVSIEPGAGLAVTGPAGSGKSMLARALVGGLRPSSALRIGGDVLLDGEVQAPRAATRTPAQRRAIQLVVHDPERPAAEVHTVRTQLRRAVRRARPGAVSSAVGARVAEILRLVGLGPELLLTRICDLPAEQQHRLAIGRALAHDPGLIVCDGLGSAAGEDGVLELCASLRRATGVATILLTRGSEAASRSCDRELRLGAAGGPELVARGAAAAPGLALRAA